MTQTRLWLESRRRELSRLEVLAAVLAGAGAVMAAFGFGAVLAHLGVYRSAPLLVLAGWITAAAAVVWTVATYRNRSRRITPPSLATRLESDAGLRGGSVRGLATDLPATGSPELGALADERMFAWLSTVGVQRMRARRADSGTALRRGATFAAVGALALWGAQPFDGPARVMWHPLYALVRSAPVLALDRESVERGQSVTATIDGAGRNSVVLWTRVPGENWSGARVQLNSEGMASLTLGPIVSDLFVRVSAGSKHSETKHITVFLPALMSELSLIGEYPAYLSRSREPLIPGDSVVLPVGTRIVTTGRATMELTGALWTDGEHRVDLAVAGAAIEGALMVATSGRWRIEATTRRGTPLSEGNAFLDVIAVSDSVPVITIPVPGADTTAPLTLLQPLVVDVRDDYLLTAAELVSRRVSRLGLASQPAIEAIELPRSGTDRTVLQVVLDLNNRGFLPGDTAYYKVRARDNHPARQLGESREYWLRLPTLRELRNEVSDRSNSILGIADSLAAAQRELNRLAEELAAERGRDLSSGDQLPFNSAERARQLSEQQQELLERAQQVQDDISELAEMAAEAGINDPQFYEQLRAIQELLREAISSELQERLQQLREALERLDSRSLMEALRDLAERQEQLREDLERSRDLFERAAMEGRMTTLADEAEQIVQEQAQWNQAAEFGDSSLAVVEAEIAAATDSLAARLQELSERMQDLQAGQVLDQSAQHAGQAASQMTDASQMAQQGHMSGARQAGEAASQSMEGLPREIRDQREQMREAWREEVIALLDAALSEVADLARRQQQLTGGYASGSVGAETRGDQAAVRDGVDRVIQRLQQASGMNALVSPRLSMALGFTKLKMTEALNQLAQASPNARQAGEASGQALDGLIQVAHGLIRGRADVQGSESGSGLQEALERLSQMAQAQQGLNGQTNQLLPMMSMGGDQLLQQLRQLAMQQMQLADELDRLESEGNMSGLSELAEEAREVARRLDRSQLDRATVERQERLFRRMLDAGRTLRSDRPDERLERQSRRADRDMFRAPQEFDSAAAGTGPRFRYPGWETLGRLSPEERRLVLEYFRRINEGRNE